MSVFSEHEQTALDALADRLRTARVPNAEDAAAEFVLWLRDRGWRPTAARPVAHWKPGSSQPAPPAVALGHLAEIRAALGITTSQETTTS